MAETTRSAPIRLAGLTPTPSAVWRLHVLATPDELHRGAIYRLEPGELILGRQPNPDCNGTAFDDDLMSREHVALTVHDNSDAVEIVDLGSHNGTWVGGERIDRCRIGHGAVVRIGGLVAVLESDPGDYPEHDAPSRGVPGRSALARRTRGELSLAAADAHPALIVGPTGSGKEFAAAELHEGSRRPGPLVRVNISAIPNALFESELFGHVKGAFSGASAARQGRLREADEGTLVLDEIGELGLLLQPKLLRAIEEGSVRPVGGSVDRKIDVRVVAATNADLHARIEAGTFRRDLAARLRTHLITLPALADRKPDLLALADAVHPLLHRGRRKAWRDAFTTDAVETLLLHDWPDNLRGLKAVLVRASSCLRRGRVALAGLPEWLREDVRARLEPVESSADTKAACAEPPSDGGAPSRPRRRLSLAELDDALRRHKGNVEAVAREHGVFRRQVYRWMRYVGMEIAELGRYRD